MVAHLPPGGPKRASGLLLMLITSHTVRIMPFDDVVATFSSTVAACVTSEWEGGTDATPEKKRRKTDASPASATPKSRTTPGPPQADSHFIVHLFVTAIAGGKLQQGLLPQKTWDVLHQVRWAACWAKGAESKGERLGTWGVGLQQVRRWGREEDEDEGA